MLSITCDVCDRLIKDTGYICDLVEAKLVYGEDSAPHMAERGRILSLYMCRDCASQIQRRIHTIRARAHAANDPAPPAGSGGAGAASPRRR